jgi:hypothetical protein
MPVAWVVAPQAQPSGPDQFAVTIMNMPADENGQPRR